MTPRQHAAEDLFALVQDARPIALSIFTSLGLSDQDGTLFETIHTFTKASLGDARALNREPDRVVSARSAGELE